MAKHIDLGKQAEEISVTWLKAKGFELKQRNFKFGKNEIDIIAKKGEDLYFFEVKGKKYYPYCFPEDNVTRKKFASLRKVAEFYMQLHPDFRKVSFSVLSVTFFQNGSYEIYHIEDVFY